MEWNAERIESVRVVVGLFAVAAVLCLIIELVRVSS